MELPMSALGEKLNSLNLRLDLIEFSLRSAHGLVELCQLVLQLSQLSTYGAHLCKCTAP
eukprot:CAMPEP_0178468964 /NCGR_PEP_ID=MMETSP0689_2-20121128/53186_1 /TAXON_ID=160604 /ORGANISM="Amphidinium massartii, Strain CS-259" /LENGTH=58 /DNA_ID=CAMNT_0020096027 /DNA_START=193 /DNA_END=369 /DNA_ORIENTATION=+